ncbi:hypothetical protein I317_05908 [Kwoniella heveanensis CBS 569]|uniref:Uncharacterized protein n=1 Tax=Kwoniella heveanensis BCC8398 TaxID=1296120 RepID=A0A1B9GVH1_9TREE|nr:hypothetical protein I316_03061 [Kwoniella heveanensis BCC8398]OCF40275.1 hypothetical protein I317_05908 [Kwoniella heveanensis CBS 569]
MLTTLLITWLVSLSALITAAPLEKRQDSNSVDLHFTGYWPEAWIANAGFNIGWQGGESGRYTFTGIHTYPVDGQNVTNITTIVDDFPLHSYIYHFGAIDTYPADSLFKFQINDTSDSSSFDESPYLRIISYEEAYPSGSSSDN